VPNDYWGSLFQPRGRHSSDFDKDGLLDTVGAPAFAIERRDTGELVGYERHHLPRPGMLIAGVGTLLLPDHWHRGFGIEAKQLCFCYLFENYPIQLVEAVTVANHVRARRGMERSGMRYAGRVRRLRCIGGVYCDLTGYQLFREQWEQLPIRGIVKRGVA